MQSKKNYRIKIADFGSRDISAARTLSVLAKNLGLVPSTNVVT